MAAFTQPMSAATIWSADGNSYTILERAKIVKVELPSMNKTTLVDGEKLFPKDSLNPRQVSSFQWSFDMGKVLLFVNTETMYHKTTGEVWLYDMKTSDLKQLIILLIVAQNLLILRVYLFGVIKKFLKN
jgi:hypothetical protein